MKKYLFLTLICCVLFTFHTTAQRQQQGPAAKNSKPWQRKEGATFVTRQRERTQGPNVKNRWWKDEEAVETNEVVVECTEIKGPRAKNNRIVIFSVNTISK